MKLRYVSEIAAAGLAAFAIAWGYGGAVKAQDAEYVGHSQCKVCHNKAAEGEQWNKWNADKHHKALETLKGDKAKEVAAKLNLATAPHEAPECLKCHVTGYNVETKAAPAKIKPEDGVQCESCHGPSADHVALAKQALKDKTIDVKAGREAPGEKICKECHNADNPTWDPNKYTLEDGTKAGFDFNQAWKKIAHENPQEKDSEG